MNWPTPRDSYLAHRAAIDDAVRRVLESGQYILGEEVERFEAAFAAFTGAEAAVGVASGTDAVLVALRAAGIGPGDVVATVSHTAVATVAAIELAGATPVLVDIDDVTMTMDPDSLSRTLQSVGGASAIVPVHLYGHPAPMAAISTIANDAGAVVIEDCAQAHGAEIEKQQVGSLGRAAAFSFYPTKNLGALGDGGIVTGDAETCERARLIRQYGWRERYVSDMVGLNSRLDPIQAAILGVKLQALERDNEARRRVASWYAELLPSDVRLPIERPDVRHVYHQYVIRVDRERDGLLEFLRSSGVPAAVLYPLPVHEQPAYRGRVATDPSGLEESERTCRSLVCLPMHPLLSREAVELVAATVTQWTHGR